ncbi:MAG: transporter ATP-binding protein [Verrucomicrobia bacterium]|nr:transporter ATP-binding protein [Verrucomicrobiota bacterium]
MRILFYEFALSLRRLWRRPTQTGLMFATFSISITLSLISWSLFHTIFIQNPAYDPHGDFYRISQTGGPMARDRLMPSSREDIAAWKEQQTVFSDFAPMRLYESIFVTTENGQERLLSANLSTEVLRLVHAQPLMGRLFTPEEDKIGCVPVVMLSENAWRNRFAGDPKIIGRIIKVDGVTASVVGVMPASFRFPNDQEIWQPWGFVAYEKDPRYTIHDVIVRLKPGITPERAAEDLRLITERRGKETFAAKFDLHPVVTPLRDNYLLPDMHRSALVLFALALLFILVGCANAANLVMIDFFGRTSEIAASISLGIPRAAAIRSLIFQLALISGAAAVLGSILLLAIAPHVHSAMARITTPYWLLFTPQWHHFAMAAALALLSMGIAIIAPLAYLLVVSPERIIRDGAGANRGTGRGWWRRTLMIGQVALLTVLAISAGLLLRSSHYLNEDRWGFDAQKIFVSKTAAKEADFPTPQVRLATHFRLLDELERLPGVSAAAMMTNPVGFSGTPSAFYAKTAEGLADGHSDGAVVISLVTPDIFTVFDAPFLEGETFSRDEKPDGPAYVIINATLAHRIRPGESALGREVYGRGGDPKQKPMKVTVRGVVRDFQAAGPKAAVNDFMFLSLKGGIAPASFLYVRGRQAHPRAEEVREAAKRVDPRMAIYFPNTLQEVIDTELSSVHLTTRLTLVYALAAVLLCAVGVYSITVSQILQRSREFGIRLALGIAPRPLWVRFATSHLLMAGLGVGCGLVAAALVARVLQSLLFGVQPTDPITFVCVAIGILVVSAIACIPSLFRLERINPAECLRSL